VLKVARLLRAAALAFAAGLLAGCAAGPPAPEQQRGSSAGDGATPIPFIDAHVHLNDDAMQLDLMRRFGAERAVVFWGRQSDNTSIAESVARQPDRFIAFASISPERAAYRKAWETNDPALLKTLDELLASGRFHGIGEISAVHFPSPGFPEADHDPTGPMLGGILALARKHRVPVMVHIEWTRLQAFSELLRKYPDVDVIWAHGGYTPLFIARRMLERHPNLFYELSARTWPVHPRSPDYTILRDGVAVWPQWLVLIEALPHRFVVGTDASQRSLESDEMKFAGVQAFLRQLGPKARELVGRGNMLRLLGVLG
jgi:predicted TIM-barrel fold metal-dependent hydrolase